MAGYQGSVSSELPFFRKSDKELNALFGRWSDRRDNLDLYDLFSNPDKFDECDPDLMLTTPCSEYYSVHGFNKLLRNHVLTRKLSRFFTVIIIIRIRIRSLSKNLNLFEELLCSLDFKLDILGITETKLSEKSLSLKRQKTKSG